MPTLLDDHIARTPDAPALTDDGAHGPVHTTWRELGEQVHRWHAVLTGAGLTTGDRVACVLGNGAATYELVLACLHAGLTLVPVNWHLTAPEIAHIVTDSGSRALVVEPGFAPVAADALARADEPALLRLVLGDRDTAGFAAAAPLLSAADAGAPAAQTCGSTMLYTSGTTGAPKGVDNGLFVVGAPMERVARLGDYARTVLGVPARGTVLLDGPWYHSSQLFFSLLPLLLGSRLVIRPRFDAAETLAVIDREGVTAAHLVPTQLIRLLRLPAARRRRFDGATLRMVWHGSGPCPVGVKHRMIDWWGPVLTEYYGATEGGAVTLIDSRDWLRRPGSVGRAVPSCELLVVDEQGDPVPAGTTGRVFVRRRTGRSFRYHNAPEKTRSAHLAPATFTFGELGHLDDDGFLFLDGRSAELIVSGGVNVYPAEVEAVLVTHPALADAAVLGVPDAEFGERVVGVVELGPQAPTGPGLVAELDAHCRRSLAGFKVPRAWHVVAALPREATGKLRREALRALLDPPATAPSTPDTTAPDTTAPDAEAA